MDFMDDLENDPDYRKNVNIFKNNRNPSNLPPVQETDDEDDERPRISLHEMLEDLVLDDAEMEDVEGEDGDMD
jgi:nonsense-mediated mRNA decay protein 3